jgi:glycosyltransferase involved in cell wall biosynthesis
VFVGRLIPNKRPDDVIRFFHAYKTLYNPRARLILAGSYSGFETYLAQLHTLIADLGARDVHIVGQVTNAELTAIYDCADLFLCASEHEGFCVPLIESFYKRVPVLAYAATAVPATMDGGGVLYDRKDPAHVAALMHALVSDQDLADQVLDAQDAALDRLLKKDFSGLLLGFVKRALDAPRKPQPAVTFDFWRQYKLAEELAEIRFFRPSAFRALPVETAESIVAELEHRRE